MTDGDIEDGNEYCQLYLVTPPAFDPNVFADDLAAALDAGPVGAVQLRLKDVDDDTIRQAAERLLPICRDHGVPLIMNDRPDLAVETDCDGVHVGQGDASYTDARKAVGDDRAVGVTCHSSRHLAMEAGEAGADYVAFGAFFPTGTKQVTHQAETDILNWWSELFVVPLCRHRRHHGRELSTPGRRRCRFSGSRIRGLGLRRGPWCRGRGLLTKYSRKRPSADRRCGPLPRRKQPASFRAAFTPTNFLAGERT